MALRVIIIGAGTGGLCLAQGLRAAGVSVEVYERNHSPTDRLHGHRLHISTEGSSALERCLPAKLFRQYLDAAAKPNDAVTFLDSQLRTLLTIPMDITPAETSREIPISRITLRKLLLKGLDRTVHFGKLFERYEESPDGHVIAYFEDGSIAEGDVLVGADGASSRVRRQLLPQAKRIDTGIVTITGKVKLDERVRNITPAAFFHGPTLVLGSRGRFLFGSAVEFASDTNGKRSGSDGDEHPDDLLFGERVEYVMWGFSAHRESFGDLEHLARATGDELKSVVMAQTLDWNSHFREVVRAAPPETLSFFEVKTSVRLPPWPTRRVTLLGDALHNMTPYRGMGANMALLDAASLCQSLIDVDRGRHEALEILHACEAEMIQRGFDAVEASLQQMSQVHTTNRLASALRRLFFGVVDRLPVKFKKAVLKHR